MVPALSTDFLRVSSKHSVIIIRKLHWEPNRCVVIFSKQPFYIKYLFKIIIIIKNKSKHHLRLPFGGPHLKVKVNYQ